MYSLCFSVLGIRVLGLVLMKIWWMIGFFFFIVGFIGMVWLMGMLC